MAGRLLSVVHLLAPDEMNRRFGNLPFFYFTPIKPDLYLNLFFHKCKVRIFLALVLGKGSTCHKICNLNTRRLLTVQLLKLQSFASPLSSM